MVLPHNNYIHSVKFSMALLFVICLITAGFVSAQTLNEPNPFSELSNDDLYNTYEQGLSDYYNDFANSDDLNIIGNAGLEITQELAYRALDYNYQEGLTGEIDFAVLVDLESGNLYKFTHEDYIAGRDAEFLLGAGEYTGLMLNNMEQEGAVILQFVAPLIGSFYNSLPDMAIALDLRGREDTAVYMSFVREIAPQQLPLTDALARFKRTALADDPFVKLGLRYTDAIILVEADDTDSPYINAPSQYNSIENTIYINPIDLMRYGDVLIFHELLQSGMFNALVNGYIDGDDFNTLKNFGDTYFSNYGMSYIGGMTGRDSLSPELSILTAAKAFAIGYTYKRVKKDLQGKARDRFIADVDNNKNVLTISVNGSLNLFMNLIAGDGKPDSYVTRFTNMFLDDSSSVNRDIQVVIDKIKKETFIQILPALFL